MKARPAAVDPLEDILERHLLRTAGEEGKSQQVIDAILEEYLKYLKTQGVHIPNPVKSIFADDLKEEIRELVIKRSYGSITPEPLSSPLVSKVKPPRKMA